MIRLQVGGEGQVPGPDATVPPDFPPRTFAELLRIPAAELHRVDIARMNLLCATDLPDTANLDVEALLKQLDAMATMCRARMVSLRPLRVKYADLFEGSEPLWRVYCIDHVLRNDFGVHYCEEERDRSVDADWSISSRHLLHGLLGPDRHGTCASMPVLITAVGRRLDYPMTLVHSPGHFFCRWDGLGHRVRDWREKRNFEVTNGFDSYPDEHYYESPIKWDERTHREERQREKPLFLRSLEPHEELSGFLALRGYDLEAHRLFDAAREAYEAAGNLDTNNSAYAFYARRCHQIQLDSILKRWWLTAQEYGALLRMRHCGKKFLFPWEGQEGIPSVADLSSGFTAEEARTLLEFQFWTKVLYPSQGIIPGVLPDPHESSPTDKELLERMQPVWQMPGPPVPSVSSPNPFEQFPLIPPGVPSCTNPLPGVLTASIPTPVIHGIPKAIINISTRTRTR